jgi:archaellum component FlaC
MKKVGKITNTWKKALQQIRSNQFNDAIETLDECLMILAMATEDNIEELDGVSVDLWKTRVWVKLEDLDVVPAYDAYI